MQTSVRAIKLTKHDFLVLGFIRTSTQTIPQDIADTISRFTSIFAVHHFLLFDAQKTKFLSFSAAPDFLQDNESEHDRTGAKIHTFFIEPHKSPFAPIRFLRYSMREAMRCRPNNLSDYLTTTVPSHFTNTMTTRVNEVVQINGITNDHFDIIWEHFPNATFKTQFAFPLRVVFDEDDFLDEQDDIKKIIYGSEKVVNVFHENECVCEMAGKCNFKMRWRYYDDEVEYTPMFEIKFVNDTIGIKIEYNEGFFPVVENLWKVFRLEGKCVDEMGFEVLWAEIAEYESYYVDLFISGERFSEYEMSEEMVDQVVESLDGFDGDFRFTIVGMQCWCERE